MKRPKLIAIEGIDGSGKTGLAKLLASSAKGKTAIIELTKYPPEDKPYHAAGRVLNKIVKYGEENRSKKMVTLGYLGNTLVHPLYVRKKKKGMDYVFLVRSPRYNGPVLAEVYGGSLSRAIGRVVKHISPRPNTVILASVPPETAIKNIRERDKSTQLHENLDDLRKMSRGFEKVLGEEEEKYKKKGFKVFRWNGKF